MIKGNSALKSKLEPYIGLPNFISSVSVFELFLRKTNIKEVEDFIAGIEIIPVDGRTAKKASELSKEMQRLGFTIDFKDLFIASTCILNNVSLATFNKKHFQNIKELRLLEI